MGNSQPLLKLIDCGGSCNLILCMMKIVCRIALKIEKMMDVSVPDLDLYDNDKEIIGNNIFEQCIKQNDSEIRRQSFTTIRFLIECDFCEKCGDLLSNIAKCIQTNHPYMILGGLSILLSVYKKL